MTHPNADFDYIRQLVRERAAIVLEPGKSYLAESRLASVARKEGLASLQQLVSRLRAQPYGALHRRVVEAMATNETSFFRDDHPFEALRRTVLPDLLQRRAAERALGIWSAACASGQEPYSIAMLLREDFPELAGWRVRFIATDLSTDMVERCRAGRYSQLEVNRGLPAPLLPKYFRKVGTEWEVSEELRRSIEFRALNLATEWPLLPQLDVVFLRNVLIYFDLDTKRAIMGRVRRVLRRGGFLFLGSAETAIDIDEGFERLQLDRAACYRVG